MPESPQVGQAALAAFEGLDDTEKRAALGRMSDPAKKALLGALKVKQNVSRVVDPAKNLVATPDTESTVGSRTREAATGLLEPFSARDAAGNWQRPPVVQGVLDTVRNVELAADPTKSVSTQVGALRDIASGLYHSTVDPVADWVSSLAKGDYDAAANAAGKFPLQVAPGVAGAVDTIRGAVPSVGELRETARRGAQSLTGVPGRKIVGEMVDKYNDATQSAKLKQSELDTATAQENIKNRQSAQRKNIENQVDYDVKVKEAEAKAARETAEAAGKNAADRIAAETKATDQTESNRAKAAKELAANRETAAANSRAEGVTRSIKEGSEVLGARVKNLDALLREEAGTKYAEVKKAVADDPGVPLTELAEAARYAENNILKGSSENIKQFRELVRKAPEDEGVVSGGVTFPPGSRLFEMLQEQGALEPGGMLPFDELQGYSSEIGRKLAQGGLPGDIYQALKYVKEKIDSAKTTIADRNGAGATLRNADNFWRDYMDLFYDKDSAIAKVREAVGSKNPGEMANEFFKGKSDELAIGKLKKLKSTYAKDASSIADLAQQLKGARAELDTLATGKVRPVEAPQRVAAAPVSQPAVVRPSEVTPPKPVGTKMIPSETVPTPTAPTAEDIVASRREGVVKTAENMGKLTKYDIPILAGSVIGTMLGGWARAVGLATEGLRFGVPAAMKRPAVVEWIARPTASDLALIEKLPEPARAELRSELQKIIASESKARRIAVDPAVQRLLQQSPSGGVKNRKDALQALGR